MKLALTILPRLPHGRPDDVAAVARRLELEDLIEQRKLD